MSDTKTCQDKPAIQWSYRVIPEYRAVAGSPPCRTFGMLAVGRMSNGWRVYQVIHDVSLRPCWAGQLARLYTEQGRSPVELPGGEME